MARRKASAGPVPFGQHKKGGFFKGTPHQQVTMSTKTPQQQGVLDNINQYLGRGVGGLDLPGGQSNFAPIAEQAQRNFQQRTVPTLAERFGSLGNSSGASLSSPDLYKQLGNAGANLEGDLASLQSQHGLQQQGQQANNYFNLLNAGLGSQFDYEVMPGQRSGISDIWNSAKGTIGNAAIGYATGGPAGATAGILSGLMNPQQYQQYLDRQQQQPEQQQPEQPPQQQRYIPGTAAVNNSIFQGYGQNAIPQQQQYQPQQSMLGTSGLNNTILQGYGQNMLPQSNLLFQNRQF